MTPSERRRALSEELADAERFRLEVLAVHTVEQSSTTRSLLVYATRRVEAAARAAELELEGVIRLDAYRRR